MLFNVKPLKSKIVEIDLIDMDLIAIDTTATIVRILESHASFARNQTVDPGNIYKRNKMLKRPYLSPGTLANSTPNRLILASVLIGVISNMLLILKAISMTTTTTTTT